MGTLARPRVLTIDSLPLIDEALLPTPKECTLTSAAMWSVVSRAVEQHELRLPTMCGATPEAVRRAAEVACQNLCATMPITPEMQAATLEDVRETDSHLRHLQDEFPHNQGTLFAEQKVLIGNEMIHMTPGPEPQKVDYETAYVMRAALDAERRLGVDEYSRAAAADALLNLHVLQETVSVAS